LGVERIVTIRGCGLPIRGNDVDTDRIIPARFLKSVTFEGLDRHLFEDDPRPALADPAFAAATIMVVNANFGCGSSREHAPQAIQRRGIRAMVGQSFSEIFFGNAVVLGMPCATASQETIDALMAAIERDPSRELTIDLHGMRVTVGEHEYQVQMPAAAREAFLDGSWDATGLLTDRFEDVEAVAARLPYVTGAW
jgi:3-isopropylmalate/(R)-2-methylmalate dehydratase small subunit